MPGLPPLTIPRTLALRLLHEAQVHGAQTAGLIAENGTVHPLRAGQAAALPGEKAWASYDCGDDRFHLPRRFHIRIETAPDTRGVLQMRCYENGIERPLSIPENT